MRMFHIFNRQEKFLLATLSCVQFNHIVDFVIMMPLGPSLMREFALLPSQFSHLVSAYSFSAGIAGILVSTIIDRFDRKHALLFFFAGFGFSTIFCGLAKSYESLLVARLLAGAFGGIIASLAVAIVSDTIGPERRATALGTLATSFSIASIAGVPLGLYLANQFSWHAPFFALGLISLFLLALIFFVVPNVTLHLQRQKPAAILAPLRDLLTDRRQFFAALFVITLTLSSFAIIPFVSPSFVANAGMREADLPLLYLFGGICSIVTSPLVGRLADEKGKFRIFRIFAFLNILPVLLITSLTPQPLHILLLVSSAFFITMSARMVPGQAMISSAVTNTHRGSFMSLINAIQSFSMSLGAYVSGQIVTKSPTGQLLHFPFVGYVSVGFTLLCIYFASRMVPAEGSRR